MQNGTHLSCFQMAHFNPDVFRITKDSVVFSVASMATSQSPNVSVSVLNSQSIHFKRKSYFRHTALFIFLHQWSRQLCVEDIYFSCFMTKRVSGIKKKPHTQVDR